MVKKFWAFNTKVHNEEAEINDEFNAVARHASQQMRAASAIAKPGRLPLLAAASPAASLQLALAGEQEPKNLETRKVEALEDIARMSRLASRWLVRRNPPIRTKLSANSRLGPELRRGPGLREEKRRRS